MKRSHSVSRPALRRDESRPATPTHPDRSEESLVTVLVALAVNVLIAAGKIFAGLIGSSSALLSEGAHSTADTFNEVLLFTGIKRSGRTPDPDHPFGYGKERFFYSLMAGVGIFVARAG